MFGVLRRQETRILVSSATHSVCDEIVGIVVDLSGTVIDTAGLMARYAAVYICIAGKDDEIIRYARIRSSDRISSWRQLGSRESVSLEV